MQVSAPENDVLMTFGGVETVKTGVETVNTGVETLVSQQLLETGVSTGQHLSGLGVETQCLNTR